MAHALLERGIRPDVIVGTSIGAINGAALAADPTPEGAERLAAMWARLATEDVLGGTLVGRLTRLVRHGTHLHSNEPLRALLTASLPVTRIEELAIPFQCVAASIERAEEHWFSTGPVVPAVLASAALPGVLPAVEIDGEHFLDGGLVNSIPIARAVALGADVIYVLHVGRIEQPLVPPRLPWEVGFVAFEIARRHRFHSDLRAVPEHVTVHVLPTGRGQERTSPWTNLRYRDSARIGDGVERARDATLAYLDDLRQDV
ncbi:MAG: patatin-like phospholipase family protein [Frankiaceae bacterium]|nr:patatin-like phospholipase family protein [Frankiaceae bacterium]